MRTNPAVKIYKEILGFFSYAKNLSYSKGEIILRPGQNPDGAYRIKSGFIKVYSIDEAGEESYHVIYRTGEIFPLILILTGNKREVFYEALTDVELQVMSKARFFRLMQLNRRFSLNVSRQVAEQFYIYVRRVENLELRHAADRVACRLEFLAYRFGRKLPDGRILIDAPITQEIIARTINLTRETTSREIEKLAVRGIIGYQNHRIVINNIEHLQKMF